MAHNVVAKPQADRALVLPAGVVSPTDIARLCRELELLNEYFIQQHLRKSGTSNVAPRLSRLLDATATENNLNMLQQKQRDMLLEFFVQLDSTAPVVHISFGVDPPGAFVQQLISWLREHIDSRMLVTVGLQPNIGAGCVLRTTNRVFDFSLREFFIQKRSVFADKLHEVVVGEVAPSAAEVAEVV